MARLRHDPLRVVAIAGCILAVALAVRVLLKPSSHTVYPVFAAGASHWWADEPLYASYRPHLDYFRYPPLWAVAMTPFDALGLRAGGVLWAWLNLALFGVALSVFVRDVAPGKETPARHAAFFALAAAIAVRSFWNGQSNPVAVGLVLFGAAAIVRQRWWLAAACLAAAIQVKLTPIPLALLLCALWPRQLVGRFAIALTIGFLLPFLTRPPAIVLDQYAGYFEQLTTTARERWPGFRDAWTVGVVGRYYADGALGPVPLKEPLDSTAYRVLQLLTGAATLLWCWSQRRRGLSDAALVNATLGMGTVWVLLFGPAVEHPTFAFLAPSLAWGVVQRERWPRGQWLVLTSATFVLVLGWGELGRLFPFMLVALPFGTALFGVWLAGATRATISRPGRDTTARSDPAPALHANTAPAHRHARPPLADCPR